MMYDELIKRLRECTAEMNEEKTLWHQAADAIEELEKRKYGKWLWNNHNGFSYCSCCDAVSPHEDQYGEYCDRPNYCPNCGAKMENLNEQTN